jgi:splicing factor 3A subunit 3
MAAAATTLSARLKRGVAAARLADERQQRRPSSRTPPSTMSSTLLEKARGALEEIEALESLAVETMSGKVSGAKASMERDGVLSNVVDGMAKSAEALTLLYADRDGAYREEVGRMRGVGVFTNFYGALKETREYYARFARNAAFGAAAGGARSAVEAAKTVETQFSGEEMWGKYLDLGRLHRQFCNVPGAPGGIALEYVAYLRMLASVPFGEHLAIAEGGDAAVSAKRRSHGGYVRYVRDVDAYLADFWKRTQPLVDLEPLLKPALDAFHVAWDASRTDALEGDELDLGPYGAAAELEALGLDRLKRALAARGLKVGGDAEARAARLFAVKGLAPEDVDPKLRQGRKRARGGDGAAGPDRTSKKYAVALGEARVRCLLAQHLETVLDATLRRAERKLTRTTDEIRQELRDEEFGVETAAVEEEEEEDEEQAIDAPIYNPKNLPLGWDGRPIPYWLYKLHGLDVSYVCEICGNQTYWGRRAFDQHFNEWRHSHGMRCLRIPNTKHFHGVVKMDDAVALWEQLQEKQDAEAFKPERDEEYEDSDGNVLNRATYEDLARQGLL